MNPYRDVHYEETIRYAAFKRMRQRCDALTLGLCVSLGLVVGMAVYMVFASSSKIVLPAPVHVDVPVASAPKRIAATWNELNAGPAMSIKLGYSTPAAWDAVLRPRDVTLERPESITGFILRSEHDDWWKTCVLKTVKSDSDELLGYDPERMRRISVEEARAKDAR